MGDEDEIIDWADPDYLEEPIEIINDPDEPQLQMKKQISHSYEIVKLDDMEKKRTNIINECMEFTFCSRDESILVMIYLKWNLNGLKDLWYNNPDQYKINSGIELNINAIEKHKQNKVPNNNSVCLICDEDLKGRLKLDSEKITPKLPFQKYFYSLKCNHNFCCDCWIEYVNAKLDDPYTLLYTTCPQTDCNIILTESVMMNFILSLNSQEKYNRFNKSVLKNFTDNNKTMKWCPNPDCGVCVSSFSHFNKEIECECGEIFCFSCGKEGHRPCGCKMIAIWEAKNNSESENVKWLVANTKQCPSCRKCIEKNQGCNHMTCNKSVGGCGYEFCWICLGDWKPHGNQYYNCNVFDPKKEENIDLENNINRAKTELARYAHYFNRYMNHNSAMKLAIKLKVEIKQYIKDFISKKNTPYEELEFLEVGVETVIKSRRKLKNTYIFGFYIKDVPEKQLFEYQQRILEKEADLLHEYLEGNEIKNLLKIDNYEEFNKGFTEYKSKIRNLYNATVNYTGNFVNAIENDMISLIDYELFK